MKGPNLHGREAATTYEAATDLLVDKLERQIERRRDKVVQEPRRRARSLTPSRSRSRRSSSRSAPVDA